MSGDAISSVQNPRIKTVRALAGRTRERRETGAFLAEGVRLIEEALDSNWPFRYVLYTGQLSERGKSLLSRIKERGIETNEVSERALSAASDTEASQGILAVLDEHVPQHLAEFNYVLIADAVRDPGNLGTLLRTAAAAGMEAAFLTPGTADAFAPKTVRAGMGAHFRVPIFEVTWEEIKVQASTYRWHLYLADAHGQSYWETQFRPPLALIVGGEAEGAGIEARHLATETVSIPMAGKVESLNAGVAGSILMFEVARQRRAGSMGETPTRADRDSRSPAS